VAHRTRGVREPEHVRKLFARKPGYPRCDRLQSTVGPVGGAKGRAPDMYASGKSDGGILSMKRTNKGAQPEISGQPPAEFVEKSPSAEGKRVQTAVTGTQRLAAASIGLSRVREAAKRGRSSRPWWGRHKVPYRLHWRVFIYTMFWTSRCGCTLTRINVSASDLRQEPSAVVPQAWDLCGGRRVTGVPTATSFLTD